MSATQDPQYYVYILTNRTRTLYVGVTNDLERRVYQHRNKLVPGFTSKYNVTRLAYSLNPRWKDLSLEMGAISVKKRFRPLAPLGVTWGARDMGRSE